MRIFKTMFFFCLISVALAAMADDAQTDQRINQLLNSVAGLSPTEKIVKLSGEFLGTPYQLEPAGEGSIGYFNQEPLYRLDKFDCETYVNTVVALALSHNMSEFQKNIRLINYKDGVVSFQTRDHFTDADWMVNNIHNGFVENMSIEIAGKEKVATANAFIDRKEWFQHLPISRIHIADLSAEQQLLRLAQLHQLSNEGQNIEAHIDFIPLSELLASDNYLSTVNNNSIASASLSENKIHILGIDDQANMSATLSGSLSPLFLGKKNLLPIVNIHAIPSGAVLLLVHPNLDLTQTIGTHLNVVHMGFAIWRNGILEFRAASSIHQRVIDIPLLQYLQAFSRFNPVGGVSVITVKSGME